jgi:hypothetical protein
MKALQQAIIAKKNALATIVDKPLEELAERCARVWPDADALDAVLVEGHNYIPYTHLLFALNIDGIQLSSNVGAHEIDTGWRNRDQSTRPYLMKNLPYRGVMLSSVYLSLRTFKQCITALHAVTRDGELLGFVAADFSVSDLPEQPVADKEEFHWTQFRGDPAVRGTVFMQQRATSLLDEHIDEVLGLIEALMTDHGVFHSKIHFSSGRCSLWLMEDPYSYRIHSVDEIIDPDICLAYPLYPYPEQAEIPQEKIHDILEQFKKLRFADETIYLRSSSINVMNGILGLTFSCDGSHYMPWDEFLERDMGFWLGAGAQQ